MKKYLLFLLLLIPLILIIIIITKYYRNNKQLNLAKKIIETEKNITIKSIEFYFIIDLKNLGGSKKLEKKYRLSSILETVG